VPNPYRLLSTFVVYFRKTAPVVALILLCLSSPLLGQGMGEGRAVLVTGASSGIGLKMTEILSANGFFVYAGARKSEDLARLDGMENVRGVRLDVTVPGEIDAAVDFIRGEGRGLYGLVNNAGVAVVGPLIEMPEEDMLFQLDVNLMGPYRVTKAFAPLLIESRGRIMNTSSLSGIVSGGFLGAYSMSKHGVEAYTDALAAEVGVFGIAVAAVEPGNYKSEIVASMRDRMRAAGYTPENSRYDRSMFDLFGGPEDRSHLPEPTEVARAALDFFSTDSPQRRYLVVPNQREAEITIRKAMEELVQLNGDHPFSYDRDTLIRMLDEALSGAPPHQLAGR
jgi:NAD(P)-dependent dehydrogenase (short-subunit alcohol dehydrogenase family)